MEISITIPETEKKKLETEIYNKVNDLVDMIFSKSQDNIIEMGAVNSGFLLKSGNVLRENKTTWKIIYNAPYAIYIHEGTDPHRPPVEPLIEWAQDKLGLNYKDAQNAGWAIANKIAVEGTEAKPFLYDALNYVKFKF